MRLDAIIMPVSPVSRIFIRTVSKFGEDINIKRIDIAVDDYGDPTDTVSTTIPTRALVTEITGYSEAWELSGVKMEGDYIVSFKPTEKIDVGDLVEINDEDYEVTNKILRKTGNKTDYIETLVRRKR